MNIAKLVEERDQAAIGLQLLTFYEKNFQEMLLHFRSQETTIYELRKQVAALQAAAKRRTQLDRNTVLAIQCLVNNIEETGDVE